MNSSESGCPLSIARACASDTGCLACSILLVVGLYQYISSPPFRIILHLEPVSESSCLGTSPLRHCPVLVSENGVCWKPARLRPGTTTARFCILIQVWLNLNKRLYAPTQHSVYTQIFTKVRRYALRCYLRYSGFPRRTLLRSSLIKPASYALVPHRYAGVGMQVSENYASRRVGE